MGVLQGALPVRAVARVLDVRVDAVGLKDTIQILDEFVRSGAPHQVVTVNLDFIRIAQQDDRFRAAVNGADLSVADGAPVLWAARLLGTPLVERVTGVDIVEQGAALAAANGYGVFLLGAAPGVAEAAGAELRRRHQGLRIVGTYSPPFGPFTGAEEERMVNLVRCARPAMLFVAFGAPRQDLWIRRHLHSLGVPVCVGVGGTFDLLAGRLKRSPRWMQRSGLEWIWRLKQEPRRLWRRYLLGDAPLMLRIAWRRFFGRPQSSG